MIMKGEERRAFTTAKLSLVHNLTVDCLTFAHFLLPSHTFNDFLGHHHHWMEWLGATIDINGFSMVLRSGNHWFQWFTMVFHHWSNDGMVAYHRWSLVFENYSKRGIDPDFFMISAEEEKELVVSSVRSSSSDDGLLYIQGNFFRFSLSPLIQLMLKVSL